ncbi:MAG: DNA translocase FtsK 4TM domain-containing protein [Patescibacteria group bacterium]|jgi:S-DNA-T family DNA segregation ATPase FtsK/SpoIIIE
MSLRRKRKSSFRFQLDVQTQKGIATVFCFALAIFILLSLFDLAGSFGMGLDQALSHIFGWDKIVVPFFILAAAIFLLSPERLPLKISNGIGFTLFFIGLNPLVHLLTFGGEVPPGAAVDAAAGKLGFMLADPFIPIFGEAGALIFFAALFAVSLVLIFNTSLSTIFQWVMTLLTGLKTAVIWMTKPFVWLFSSLQTKMARRHELQAVQSTVDSQSSVVSRPSSVEEDDQDAQDDQDDAKQQIHKTTADDQDQTPPPKPKRHRTRVEIPLELLNRHDQKPTSGDIVARQAVIQRTLETFGIPIEMGEVSVGPTITQFTFKPSDGIKLNKITALHNDLALALAAHPIRIEAPIPGKSLVGIEVPNQSVAIVGLRELFETREWRERKSAINFALGRDVTGKPWMGDIARMPHLLVAGATGSGKSVCLNTIIMSLLYSNGPDDLRLILVDPKRVEFPVYNGIPHLITPVITEVDKTVNAMKWAVREMNRRFDLLSKQQARDIASYNQRVQEKLPYLVMIIDELADLMVTNKQEVESQIVRLAQMSRAVGIHLVLATQRPSVDVITGLIKANIPARIAFSVASQMDSRTILDQSGADKLIGRGDMLYSTAEMTSPRRIQGVYVADDEINRVVEYIKSKYEPADYDVTVVEKGGTPTAFAANGIADEDSDVLLSAAKEEIIRAGRASASLLQRRLKVGYARAARLLDLLEQEGFIGPGDGAKPREILKVEFTKGMDQVPAPVNQAALEQVNREIPELDEEL